MHFRPNRLGGFNFYKHYLWQVKQQPFNVAHHRIGMSGANDNSAWMQLLYGFL